MMKLTRPADARRLRSLAATFPLVLGPGGCAVARPWSRPGAPPRWKEALRWLERPEATPGGAT